MPVTLNIENADILSVSQGLRLLALLRASESYRQNLGLYADLDAALRKEINRKFAITAATNAAPIVLTATSHNFVADEPVSVEGVAGNTAANGEWLAASVSGNNCTLANSAGNGVYTSGGNVLSLKSKQLSAIVEALDELGDGTTKLKGGRDGLDDDAQRDREALLAEALSVLYSLDSFASSSYYGAGQRCGPQRVEFSNGVMTKIY